MATKQECCICLEETICTTHYNGEKRCEGGYLCKECQSKIETDECPVCKQPRLYIYLDIDDPNEIVVPVKKNRITKCFTKCSDLWKGFMFKDCVKLSILLLFFLMNYLIMTSFKVKGLNELHIIVICLVLSFTQYCLCWFVGDVLIYLFCHEGDD